MARYFCELAYNGTNYCGWQIQPNAPSVQETLEKAFSTILRENIQVTGCGRTDTGVHAKYFVAHFNTTSEISNPGFLARKMNSFLPKDILIFNIAKVNDDCHARFDAINREYEYHVILRKDPFLNQLATKLIGIPDFDKMNLAAKILFRHTDFTSFSKLHTDVKTNNCDVRTAQWEQVNEHHWLFRISADRFLRNMVRAVVGTLLEVGNGKKSISEFEAVINQKNRGKAGTSVPAHGLYLTKVEYPYDFGK